VTGKEIPAVVEARRAGDPAVLVASSDPARRELGWNPTRNKLEDIIGSAWAWHKANPHGYND
ncbi:UDP-glucose 4-epimerase GalE, partial [Paenibacillus sepulcri]|nr:UDP-glucose 4-epimerase GalE [Paenibacillus sepulcri]